MRQSIYTGRSSGAAQIAALAAMSLASSIDQSAIDTPLQRSNLNPGNSAGRSDSDTVHLTTSQRTNTMSTGASPTLKHGGRLGHQRTIRQPTPLPRDNRRYNVALN